MASKSPSLRLKLPSVDTQTLADLVIASADVTIVIDGNDVVEDLSHNLRDPRASLMSSWRGKRIDKVVSHASVATLKSMLLSARSGEPVSSYEIGHRLDDGNDLPLQYSAHHIGDDGQVVLFGRDLRPTAALQSRLIASRQSLEQNRRRQRQFETHYRILFETASDPIVIVDAETGKVRDANPRASALLDSAPADLVGKTLISAFDRSQRTAVKAMMSRLATTGAPATLSIEAVGNRRKLALSAEIFRSDDLTLILLRISPLDLEKDAGASSDGGLGDLVRNASEAILLIDEDGVVDWANESFLALADIPLAAQVVGKPVNGFLRWQGVELGAILDKVRKNGRVPMVSGVLRASDGRSSEVETSIVARSGSRGSGYALVMRTRPDDETGTSRDAGDVASFKDNLIEMVGRVPMKDLVRDTTDVIERMCIESALKLAGNNRASAARALGLSRQALYLKLRRYGLSEDE